MNALKEETREAIRSRRLALGLTQKDAAERGGMAATTFNTVEVGKSPASGLVRTGICRALGWTPDSIDRLERGETAVPDVATDTGWKSITDTYETLVDKVAALEEEMRQSIPTRPAAAAGVDLSGLPADDVELIRSQVRRLRRLNGLPDDPDG